MPHYLFDHALKGGNGNFNYELILYVNLEEAILKNRELRVEDFLGIFSCKSKLEQIFSDEILKGISFSEMDFFEQKSKGKFKYFNSFRDPRKKIN
jgi:hypothetical protein